MYIERFHELETLPVMWKWLQRLLRQASNTIPSRSRNLRRKIVKQDILNLKTMLSRFKYIVEVRRAFVGVEVTVASKAVVSQSPVVKASTHGEDLW
jgi:hypothetical protein